MDHYYKKTAEVKDDRIPVLIFHSSTTMSIWPSSNPLEDRLPRQFRNQPCTEIGSIRVLGNAVADTARLEFSTNGSSSPKQLSLTTPPRNAMTSRVLLDSVPITGACNSSSKKPVSKRSSCRSLALHLLIRQVLPTVAGCRRRRGRALSGRDGLGARNSKVPRFR